MFVATKAGARNALRSFLPRSGRDYAVDRNYDNGADGEATVSRLSPWIRTRLLPEWELLNAVLGEHSEHDAAKFIDEVCWRTYWKGWLELRPAIWADYLNERIILVEKYQKHIGYVEAIEGRTGIDCFDRWSRDLVENNYLHNHARMWYASIWIHTLKLPWQLGADWFLKHLLDGDVASNTLSWRWVAGLQTQGKTYLARPENIRKYTQNQFKVRHALATKPVELLENTRPRPRALQPATSAPKGLHLGLLVTDDDVDSINWLTEAYDIEKVATLFSEASYREHFIDEQVIEFRRAALSKNIGGGSFVVASEVCQWVEENNLDGIITPVPIEGFNKATLQSTQEALERVGKRFCTARHWWDETLYPHATHGFFRFKQAIPKVLAQLKQPELLDIFS
ncbi:MAG: FAD-binding domain-containing protein [Lentimonas sp.]